MWLKISIVENWYVLKTPAIVQSNFLDALEWQHTENMFNYQDVIITLHDFS